MSLILLDIARFINHHGEAAGDRVLCAFADCLRDTMRGMDMSFRVAEHEFAVILPGQSFERRLAIGEIRCKHGRGCLRHRG